jgi:hypothetical protein
MPPKELSEMESADYASLERAVYEIGELKNKSFLEKAPEGAAGYRILNEWDNSFKVEYYGKKEQL